jgi:DNA-binding NtrC family response regulator
MLFSDILMPGGMSGVALATEARKLHRGMGVLLTSGYSADESVDLRASGFPLIEKPFYRDKLAQMLRIALDIRRDVLG